MLEERFGAAAAAEQTKLLPSMSTVSKLSALNFLISEIDSGSAFLRARFLQTRIAPGELSIPNLERSLLQVQRKSTGSAAHIENSSTNKFHDLSFPTTP